LWLDWRHDDDDDGDATVKLLAHSRLVHVADALDACSMQQATKSI
jgi:hypothetical protein